MSDLIQQPLLRLTLLLLAAIVILFVLRRTEPAWKIGLIRGTFLGGLLLFLVSLSGLRWELPSWVKMASIEQLSRVETELAGTNGSVAVSTTPSQAAMSLELTEESSVSFTTILFAISCSVSLILLSKLVITLLKEKRRLNQGVAAPSGIETQWAAACLEAGTTPRRVVVVDDRVSPHLYLDGTLVLPRPLLDEQVSESERQHVLRHEAAHLKAGDHYWFPLLSVLATLLWFHPLVWWLLSRHLVACEEARDAQAARLGGAGAYQSSVAKVALGLLPASTPSPSLLRRNGRLVERLKRVEETSPQSPPFAAAIIALQVVLVTLSIVIGTASPSLSAATSTEELFGMWRSDDRGERFARQVEVYEWGGEAKLRLWYAVGQGTSLKGATVASFGMTHDELAKTLAETGSVSIDLKTSFSESTYTLSVESDKLEISVKTTYTDNSGRGDMEHASYYVRGTWEG